MRIILTLLSSLLFVCAHAQTKSLHQLQQEFVDLRFGMFLHYNIPTYAPEDWPDPDLSPEVFNPKRLDCRQWARAAKAAGMTYGCLTTKHHSGFCIWDTKTTDYNVMNSPLKRDVVREYVDAFRKEGLEVMLYFSILDTHHRLRRNMVTREKVDMLKEQLRELLTNYGPIRALIIDGWDAPWSRLSYDEVPFPEIYQFIKSLQPECLVMDLNAAKYPREGLFYTDIKSYEQGAGQKISTSENRLPALACLSIQKAWFWKESMPTDKLKDPAWLVNENIVPYGKAYCNFILNAAPNRDGLLDDNAVAALKEIGRLWKERGHVADVPECEAPIVERNVAKFAPAESSWSYDTQICDFANDDDFTTPWISHPLVKTPYWQVNFETPQPIDLVTILMHKAGTVAKYRVEYRLQGNWKPIYEGAPLTDSRLMQHRFSTVKADGVRITFLERLSHIMVDEVGVYTPQEDAHKPRIAFLGDSYTTFEGYCPPNNALWYTTKGRKDNDVTKVEQTWWHQVVEALGGKLEKNNSYSGATICCRGYRGEDASDRAFVTRMYNLGNPDLIFVCGGTNDSWAGVPMGKYIYEGANKADLYTFRPAMAHMLRQMKLYYPNARIIFVLNNELSKDINESVHTVCQYYGVECLDLHDIEKQSSHPSVAGMKAMADQVVEQVKKGSK